MVVTNWSEPFEVSTGDSKFVDLSDPSIIAYGELDKSLCSPEKMDSYVEFTIPIKYRNLVAKPTYVLVVCS